AAQYVVEFSGGGTLPTSLVSGLGSGATFPVGTTTETWQAVDAGNNVSTCSFTVTVIDNIKPVMATQNITIQLDANGVASISESQIDNGTTDNCALASITLSKTSFDCSNIGANIV